MPAFTWIEAPNKAEHWRTTHTCARINNRQMISIGGIPGDNLGNIATMTEGDALPNGLALFDMTTLEWTTKYGPNAAAYKPADIVTANYKTTGTYPQLWSDPALEQIFVRKDAPQNPSGTSTGTPTGTLAGTDSSAKSTSTNIDEAASKSKASIGAIVGGVIGGVAVIAIIASAIFFWRRRIQQQKNLPQVGPQNKDYVSVSQVPQDTSEMWTMGNIPETSGNPIHELQNTVKTFELGPGK